MHDGMHYDPIQGQSHEPLKFGNLVVFKSHLLCHLQWELATDQRFLTLSPRQASNPALFTITYSREASFAASPSLRHPREPAHAAIISLG